MIFLRFLGRAAHFVVAVLFSAAVLGLRRIWPGFARQMDEDDLRGP